MTAPHDRRGFLRGLATLPLIGGSVAILGKPTQAAVPVTMDLVQSYHAWLHYEHRMLSYEMAGYDVRLAKGIEGCTHMNTTTQTRCVYGASTAVCAQQASVKSPGSVLQEITHPLAGLRFSFRSAGG